MTIIMTLSTGKVVEAELYRESTEEVERKARTVEAPSTEVSTEVVSPLTQFHREAANAAFMAAEEKERSRF